MVGLLAQPEEGLVGPSDVAELHLWSSWRLFANASSQGHNQPRESKAVDVKCAKTCCFSTHFWRGAFSSKWPESDMFFYFVPYYDS